MQLPQAEFISLTHEILKKGNSFRFRAKGGSMYPFIKSGQVIHVRPVSVSEIRYGDIIFYYNGNNVIVHRVIRKYRGKNKTKIVTKGDALRYPDKDISADSILGKVVAFEREERVVRIDKAPMSFVNILYTMLLPFSRWVYLFLRKMFFILNRNKKENKVIVLLADAYFNKDSRVKIEKLLTASLNWGYIFKKSHREGITFLIYPSLNKMGAFKCSPSILTQMRRDYYANSARNAMIYEETKSILRALNNNNIKPILLKGIFLLEYIYENAAARSVVDVDLLIKKEELPAVNEILNSLGYNSPPTYDYFINRDSLSSINTLVYRKKDTFWFFVHLHWHFINSTWPLDFLVRNIDMENIWNKAMVFKIDEVNFFGLSYEHLLIYLCCHSFLHNFDRLILSYDIAYVIRKYHDKIDWDSLIDEAEKLNLSMPLYYSLLFVSSLLNINIPFIKKIPRNRGFLFNITSLFMRKCIRHVFLPYLVYFSLQKNFPDKLKFIAKTIFPPSYVLAHNFNIPSSSVKCSHYLKRLFTVTKLFETKG